MLAQLSLQEGEALLLLKEHLDLVQVEDTHLASQVPQPLLLWQLGNLTNILHPLQSCGSGWFGLSTARMGENDL